MDKQRTQELLTKVQTLAKRDPEGALKVIEDVYVALVAANPECEERLLKAVGDTMQKALGESA